jgi:choice-of-anchor A domain-containing protein
VKSAGVAYDTVVDSGGRERVSAGGIDNDALINNGGRITVLAGGVANNDTIGGGGNEYVSAGGMADDVTFGGEPATLALENPSGLTGTLSNWRVGDTIDFVNTSITNAVINGSTLTVTTSAGQTSYLLAGRQTGTQVVRQSDGNGGTDVLLTLSGFGSLIPDASGYAVLYEGVGGHNFSITNVTVNGNIGVGGTGVVKYSGPGTISGKVDFSASNIGQFQSTNGSNIGPTSVNYNQGVVTSALSEINSLSQTLGSETGKSIAFSGNMTINAFDGTLDSNGDRVFNVTSYSEGNGNVITINGDAAGDSVVFNFSYNSNVNLGGDVVLNNLTDNQVLWNFTTSGKNINLNNNNSSFPLPAAFQGDILAPNDKLSVNTANLDGSVWGGGSGDMQIIGGTTITGSGGNLTVSGAPGLDLIGASSATVTFSSGVAGTLELDNSALFTGHIAGFGGQDGIDLADIGFGTQTTLAYLQNQTNTSGVLTVSDGAHTANLALLGQYMASSFAVASDGHGGTLISDPPPSQQQVVTHPHT